MEYFHLSTGAHIWQWVNCAVAVVDILQYCVINKLHDFLDSTCGHLALTCMQLFQSYIKRNIGSYFVIAM